MHCMYAKPDVITDKKNEMKISREKRKISAKKRGSGEVIINLLFIKI